MPDAREHPIRLRYSHLGTRPPVYIATSFTSPPWEPIEMDSAPAPSVGNDQDGNDELEFFKDFCVAEGHWQYKFRLGPVDWWVCNDTVATEMDDSGNHNNVLVVEPWLTSDSHEEKRAHVRPLAQKNLGKVHDTAWEVTAGADGDKATAAETRNGLKPLVQLVERCRLDGHCETNRSHKVLTSRDGAEPTGSSNESYKHEALDETKTVADDPKPTSEPRANEPSPLFAHECLTPEHEEAEVYLHDPEETGPGTEGETRILDDCELEMFPTDREHILQRIQTTKVCLDEDETSLDGIPSPTSIPPQVSVDSLPSSGQSSPELGAIEEEDMSNAAAPPPLDFSEPVQKDQADPAHQASAPPVDAHKQVLDPGLATLGPWHQSIEQLPTPQTEAQYASPGLDGAADLLLISSDTPKAHALPFASSKTSVLSRRQSVPGSFEEREEDVDRVSHFQKKTAGNTHDSSGEGETVVEGSREGKDPGNRPVTPSTVGFAPGRKYDNLFQAFWRIIMIDWLGAILARFSWKSGERK